MIKSSEEFAQLRTSSNPSDHHRASQEPASDAVWFEIIKNYPEMRAWVAQNKTISSEVLDMLSQDPSAEVRSLVAMKRKLPERIQLLLAADPDEGVRSRLVYNDKATKRVLEILSRDAKPSIRERASERV
ncbi:MAG: hypothetical protein PHQ40_10380, partial [Anaerolineaceae bacterium]|nr:hypothetical protein [Anaerolineaceae bacterium]